MDAECASDFGKPEGMSAFGFAFLEAAGNLSRSNDRFVILYFWVKCVIHV